MNKKIRLMLILFSIFILATACKPIGDRLSKTVENSKDKKENQEIKPIVGGEITLPLTNFSTLNPILTENESYYRFSKLIYEGLFEYDKDLNVRGLLASGYSFEDGGKVVNITLKDGVKWHDGKSLSAEDIIFTIDVIKSAGNENIYGDMITRGVASYTPSNLNNIINASGSGRNVKITFDRPTSNNLEVLIFPIIPKHIFKTVGAAMERENYKVVGTGPFKYESYTKMKELNLVANMDYREGRPYLDKIKGRILDSDLDVLRAFETGQVNMALFTGVDWEQYGKNSRMKVIEFESSNYEFIGFNFDKNIFQGDKGKYLRQAIMYGIDRESMVDKIYLGHATISNVPINPSSWLNGNNPDTYKYNLEKALQMMEKAGFKDRDVNGFYKDENGEALTLTLLTNTFNSIRGRIALAIKDNMEDIGIKIVIAPENKQIESLTEEKKNNQWELVKGKLSKGEFDMVLSGWELSPITDLSFMFHSDFIGGDLNFIRYADSETDKKLMRALKSGASREEKKKSYEILNEELMEKLPYGSLFFRNKALLMDKKLEGEITPTIFNPYMGIEKIFLNIE